MYAARAGSVPHIRDYAAAVRRYETTEPIRGRTVRPLSWRRSSWRSYSITRTEHSVSCVLYETPVVTFHEDGTIDLDHGGHVTPTTCNFIGDVLGFAVSTSRRDGHMLYHIDKGTYIIGNSGLTIKAYTYAPINPEPCVIHNINRKAMNQVRKQYANNIKHMLGMCKLLEGRAPEPLPFRVRTPLLSLVHAALTATNPEGINLPLFQLMSRTSWQRFRLDSQGDEGATVTRKVKKWIDVYLISTHRDEVLVKKVLPEGEYKKDLHHMFN